MRIARPIVASMLLVLATGVVAPATAGVPTVAVITMSGCNQPTQCPFVVGTQPPLAPRPTCGAGGIFPTVYWCEWSPATYTTCLSWKVTLIDTGAGGNGKDAAAWCGLPPASTLAPTAAPAPPQAAVARIAVKPGQAAAGPKLGPAPMPMNCYVRVWSGNGGWTARCIYKIL